MKENTDNKGALFLCATPIGNLEDITLRVLRILKEADVVAAENTAHTRKLLSHFGISSPLVSYREENRDARGDYLISLIAGGKNVALVSDAGMPGLSDPGTDIVRRCREQGLPVICAPGASSVLMAPLLSGFSCSRFIFEGFLPRRRAKRQMVMKSFQDEARTIVFFEGPHHLVRTLEELQAYAGSRRICVMRELTKLHEEIIEGTAAELAARFGREAPRGEMTLVLEGAEPADDSPASETDVDSLLRERLAEGMGLKSAARHVADLLSLPQRDVYERGIVLKRQECD